MTTPKKNTKQAEMLKTALGLSHFTVTINGEEIEIRRFSLKGVSSVMEEIETLQAKIISIDPEKTALAVTQIIKEMPEIAARIIAAAIRRDVEWVNDLDFEDANELLARTVEVNHSFFTGKAMQAMVETIAGAVGIGLGVMETSTST